ncbi:hypothetical protein ACFYMW_05700 [Streptomyces sp. NPDC006692]|uniref:hypothetical protein n=1 Tax=unclassified Streptomyces TaxID=2593676 RepID=UPI0036B08911
MLRTITRYGARWGRAAHAHLPFSPVIDGEVLPCSPWEALRAGRGAGVDLIVGHTRDEARLFTVMGGALGSCHGLDVPLVFATLRDGFGPMLFGEEPPAEAEALSDAMGRAWSGFAAHGNPGWARYGAAERLTRVFATEPFTAPYPEESSRLIWAQHDFAPLELVPGAEPVPAS